VVAATVLTVLSIAAVFGGPSMALAPDLTLTLRDHGFVSVRRSRTVLASRPHVTGTHHPEGVFVARGPGIRRGETIAPLSLIDVAPTVLYTLGLAIPDDLEGRIATESFTAAHLRRHQPKSARRTEYAVAGAAMATPAGQTEEILERMKALGYLE